MERFVLILLAVTLAACPAPRRPPTRPHPREPPPPTEGPITWARVSTAAELPHAPPPPGTYRVHLIDVGTGLSILIQGADFAMLYDAGSNDPEEKSHDRVVAYLRAALGPSGDADCGGSGPKLRIDDVVLSHPHFDHASEMEEVFRCYDVHDFWESGRLVNTKFYTSLLAALSELKLTYHTAADVPPDHEDPLATGPVHFASWTRFSEGDTVKLGEGAAFTILHAEPKSVKDPNDNSVVLSVDLGGVRLLLVGDAGSGSRQLPGDPPGAVEAFLLDHHKDELRSDILQVGHHGSKTSSRHDFLVAVHPRVALVSSGPKQYGKTVLPDHEIIEELQADGATVLRTDEHDDGCPEKDRIGGDDGPGGCDSWVISIAPKP